MSETKLENVLLEARGATAWVVVNRPEKRNALDRKTIAEIDAAVRTATAHPEVRVLVVTGAGEKAFVAGADIEEMARMTAMEAQAFSREFQACLDRIERSQKPVIAAINGFALGGGCELALACHLRIAAATAKLGQPEVGLGLIPGAGGTQRLPRIVGRGRALEWILSGEMLDAAEAHRIGLVNRVAEPARLRADVEALAARIAAQSPAAIGRALEAVVAGQDLPLGEALRLESALFGLCFATDDMREGTRAFLEKRKPSFSGH
jgi:enoyl-CoA hydratase